MAKSTDYSRGHTAGYAQALDELIPVADVAAQLGITRSVLLRRAKARGLGRLVGPIWVFSREEVKALAPGWERQDLRTEA